MKEKYPFVFTMNLGNRDLKINQEDKLTLKFPETFYPVVNSKNKETTVTFTEQAELCHIFSGAFKTIRGNALV